MSPCRRPHRTNCCASAVPTIYPTLPSKPGAWPVGTGRRCPLPASSPCPTCTCATPENRAIVEGLRPASDGDWLIVAGDVAERVDDVVGTLTCCASGSPPWYGCRATTSCGPGRRRASLLRGERYHLVQACRAAGVLTPEDPFPVWTGEGGPAVVAPLFLLYDYSFLPDGTATAEEGLAAAYTAGVVCTDEHLLAPDPYPDRAAWCAARVAYSRPGSTPATRTCRRCWSTTGR